MAFGRGHRLFSFSMFFFIYILFKMRIETMLDVSEWEHKRHDNPQMIWHATDYGLTINTIRIM